ncbi:hypothetical protein H696_02576 [Fonticula alba]|uniref:Uncharacterized protein n=1 Tax=Fonticula alba TaxID=691883 RepID=A0A058Z800_FONAL|nr:hypothetical protein H696_02576 [Fonticula alba]KCV70246.1 hypothetical protein H696_02576 [Fonticula alba]|eukprot:XP_009494762.1 hypothetical protein H696_02576 [Fonticula alba]
MKALNPADRERKRQADREKAKNRDRRKKDAVIKKHRDEVQDLRREIELWQRNNKSSPNYEEHLRTLRLQLHELVDAKKKEGIDLDRFGNHISAVKINWTHKTDSSILNAQEAQRARRHQAHARGVETISAWADDASQLDRSSSDSDNDGGEEDLPPMPSMPPDNGEDDLPPMPAGPALPHGAGLAPPNLPGFPPPSGPGMAGMPPPPPPQMPPWNPALPYGLAPAGGGPLPPPFPPFPPAGPPPMAAGGPPVPQMPPPGVGGGYYQPPMSGPPAPVAMAPLPLPVPAPGSSVAAAPLRVPPRPGSAPSVVASSAPVPKARTQVTGLVPANVMAMRRAGGVVPPAKRTAAQKAMIANLKTTMARQAPAPSPTASAQPTDTDATAKPTTVSQEDEATYEDFMAEMAGLI